MGVLVYFCAVGRINAVVNIVQLMAVVVVQGFVAEHGATGCVGNHFGEAVPRVIEGVLFCFVGIGDLCVGARCRSSKASPPVSAILFQHIQPCLNDMTPPCSIHSGV